MRKLTVFLGVVMVAAALASQPRWEASECTTAFPSGEGNPWHVLEVPAEELADALWLVDDNPQTVVHSVVSESTGCYAIVYRLKD